MIRSRGMGGEGDITTFTPDEIAALQGAPAGPDALGYGAGGTGSVSQAIQGFINQAGSGNPGLPSGQQAATAVQQNQLLSWITSNATYITVGAAVIGLLFTMGKRR